MRVFWNFEFLFGMLNVVFFIDLSRHRPYHYKYNYITLRVMAYLNENLECMVEMSVISFDLLLTIQRHYGLI